jgi:hypothetical protein
MINDALSALRGGHDRDPPMDVAGPVNIVSEVRGSSQRRID